MAIPVKKNIQDWWSGKRNLLSEVEQLSKDLERGIRKKKEKIGTPSQLITRTILKKVAPELPEPVRRTIAINVSKSPASKKFDTTLDKSGVSPISILNKTEKAGNLGLSQLKSGAMTFEAAKNIGQGSVGVGQTLPRYKDYFSGKMTQDEMRGLNQELGSKGLQTGLGLLEGLGAAFRFSPFGQVTTPLENLAFGRLKQLKQGKSLTEDTNFREIGRDYFISDALGIREKYPVLSAALDIGTNLILGRVEENVAGKLGWRQPQVDMKKLQDEMKAVMNDPNIKEKGFIRFAADLGSGKVPAEEASKGAEDLNRITKEISPEFTKQAKVLEGATVKTYLGEAKIITPPNEAGDLKIRLANGEEMDVNLKTTWKELGGGTDKPFIKQNQKVDPLKTVRSLLEEKTGDAISTQAGKVTTPLDMGKLPEEVPAGRMELTTKDMGNLRGIGATEQDVTRVQDSVESAYKAKGGEDITKYKTLEDFINAKYRPAENIEDYGMSHRPTESGAIASDITKNGEFIPRDFYEHPEWYGDMTDRSHVESWSVLQRIKDKPNSTITIYRASPSDTLNKGDWVTLSKTYAKQSADVGESVKSFKVKAKDIQFAGDDINEFGFFPSSGRSIVPKFGETLSSLEDQKAYIQRTGKIPTDADILGFRQSPEYGKYGNTNRQMTSAYYEYLDNKISTLYKSATDLTKTWNEQVAKAQSPYELLNIKDSVDGAVSSGKISKQKADAINKILFEKDNVFNSEYASKVLETGKIDYEGGQSAFPTIEEMKVRDYEVDLERGLKGMNPEIKDKSIGSIEGAKNLNWIKKRFGDIYRNIEYVFKGTEAETAVNKAVDNLDTARGMYAEDVTVRGNDIQNTIVDRLGFEKGSPESALWQEYGEGLLYRTKPELTDSVDYAIKDTMFKNFGENGEARLEAYVKENPHWFSDNFMEAPAGKIPDKEAAFLKWTFDLEKQTSLDLLKQLRPNDWQRFVEADEYARSFYDEWLPKMNKTFDSIYPDKSHHIYALPNYYRHYWEYGKGTGLEQVFDSLTRANADLQGNKTSVLPAVIKKALKITDKALNIEIPVDNKAKMSSELVGLTYQTRPNSRYYSPGQARTGAEDYTRDAVGGMRDYLLKSAYSKNFNPSIAEFQAIANDMKLQTAKGGVMSSKYNGEIEYVVDIANDIAGKTNPYDRTLLKFFDYTGLNRIQALNNRVKKNVLLGNISTVVAQTANLPNGFGALGTDNMFRGLDDLNKQILTGYKDPTLPQAQLSGWLDERYLDIPTYKGGTMENIEKGATDLMGLGDEIPTRIMWNASYRKFQADPEITDKSVENLVKLADRQTAKLVAGRGVGQVPLMQKSALMRLVAPFQLEVTNQWAVYGDLFSKINNGKTAEGVKGLAMLMLASRLFNVAYEQTVGRKIVFDPIDATVDAIRKRSPGRLVGEVVGNLPFGQTLATVYPEYGFNIPTVPGVLPNIQTPTATEFFGGEAPTRFGTGIMASKGLQDPIYKLGFPLGGSQVEKTIGGLASFAKGSVKSSSGRTYTPIKQNIPNFLRAILFGKYSFPEMRIYFESRAVPLGEEQTKQMESIRTNENQMQYYRNILKQRKEKREAKESGTKKGYGSYDSYGGYDNYGSY